MVRSPRVIASADVVGDEDDRLAAEVPEVEEVGLELRAGLGVEGAERLVHEDHGRVVDERADEGRALAHAARQLVGVVALESRRGATARMRLGDPLHASASFSRPCTRSGKEHVLDQRAPGQQRVVLGHVAELPVPAGPERCPRSGWQ